MMIISCHCIGVWTVSHSFDPLANFVLPERVFSFRGTAILDFLTMSKPIKNKPTTMVQDPQGTSR